MKDIAFKRLFAVPTKSMFLLGARGTGKSTYIKKDLKPDLIIDLLKSIDFRTLNKNPSELEAMTGHLKKGQTVFIDEIQKIPELLDEVHRLIEDKAYIFYLSGSSARKLKKSGVNLLAGRAATRKFFPLSLKELDGAIPLNSCLVRGTLPYAVKVADHSEANDYLFSYVDTYLKEEVIQEGIVRNIEQFAKFIELAGLYHGQILNYENISREVGKSGDTVKAWFQILRDTLVGEFIEAYPLNFQLKETKHPKFYFFDCGIARAAEGVNIDKVAQEKLGFYFESLILNELKIYREVKRSDYKIYFYNVPSLGDIDFVIEVKAKTLSTPSEFITLDIKLSKKWDSSFEKVSRLVKTNFGKRHKKMIGVYLGDRQLTKNGYEIYPLQTFIEQLWSGEIF